MLNRYCEDKKPQELKTELEVEVHDPAELRPSVNLFLPCFSASPLTSACLTLVRGFKSFFKCTSFSLFISLFSPQSCSEGEGNCSCGAQFLTGRQHSTPVSGQKERCVCMTGTETKRKRCESRTTVWGHPFW